MPEVERLERLEVLEVDEAGVAHPRAGQVEQLKTLHSAQMGELGQEVDRLSEELSAITDALEGLQRNQLQPMTAMEGTDATPPPAQKRQQA